AGMELDDLGREVRAALLGRARAGGPPVGPVAVARLRHLERPSHPRDASPPEAHASPTPPRIWL
ncbi:MAG TPA: hypothetical protein VHR39_19365, partial [Propionibacteriaceae bacterium]|nr:hypothetical protein [Propionibacteriaceae bacterium]